MKILITGGCGFIGTNLCLRLSSKGYIVHSLDNLSRKGSKYNLALLKKKKIKNFKINIENAKTFQKLSRYDVIIDCCAEASVEFSKNDIDKVFQTNLIGTFNVLKKIKEDKTNLIFISTSRVYPITPKKKIIRSRLKPIKLFSEKDSINGPKTIYGVTKLASEMLIEEFSYAFGLKYIINRCGVVSGPLQFGKQDQGFVSLWVWRHLNKKQMKYIGYGGLGNQIRDVLHIDDLCNLILLQIKNLKRINNKIFTVGGSKKSYTSLKQLTSICEKLTKNKIKFTKISKTSIYDTPYYISDNRQVMKVYKWKPKNDIKSVVNDVYIWLRNNKIKIKKYF